MYVTDPFKHFNPKTGDVPEFFSSKFQTIAERAREILKARSGPRIRAAWRAIQWMSEDDRIQKQIWEQLMQEAQALDNGTPFQKRPAIRGDVSKLMACRELINIGDYRQFPGGTWPEYFAVLALAHIGIACDDEHHHRYKKKAHTRDRYENLMQELEGYWAIRAMEAVTTAEWIGREENILRSQSTRILNEHKKRISLQAKEAAIARHSKTAKLKDEFIQFKLAHPDVSAAEAARRFHTSLTGERRKILQPTNAVRTLTNAWTAFLKGRSSSVQQDSDATRSADVS